MLAVPASPCRGSVTPAHVQVSTAPAPAAAALADGCGMCTAPGAGQTPSRRRMRGALQLAAAAQVALRFSPAARPHHLLRWPWQLVAARGRHSQCARAGAGWRPAPPAAAAGAPAAAAPAPGGRRPAPPAAAAGSAPVSPARAGTQASAAGQNCSQRWQHRGPRSGLLQCYHAVPEGPRARQAGRRARLVEPALWSGDLEPVSGSLRIPSAQEGAGSHGWARASAAAGPTPPFRLPGLHRCRRAALGVAQ